MSRKSKNTPEQVNYNWDPNTDIIIKGGQFETLLNYLGIQLVKDQGNIVDEFKRIDLLRLSTSHLQEVFKEYMEKGIIKQSE